MLRKERNEAIVDESNSLMWFEGNSGITRNDRPPTKLLECIRPNFVFCPAFDKFLHVQEFKTPMTV